MEQYRQDEQWSREGEREREILKQDKVNEHDATDVTAQTFVVTTGKSQESDETF